MNADTHSFMVCGTRFDVPTRYSLIKAIGQGAYGVVCSAVDKETGTNVAIKKISKAFDHLTDTKRTLREIKLLKHFDHENILCIKDILKPLPHAEFDDVYLISELMDTDLHQIIGSPQPLSDEHSQYFLYQLLRGLKYIHSAHVLHRDLKPSNLLLNGNCDLKICDFGLARLANLEESTARFMTEYVATRWYRAPEILLSWKEYGKSIDMWSVGCIFAEILGRRPLFPGKDYIHQLILITDVIGTPTDDDISNISSERARRYLRSLPYKPKVAFSSLYPHAPASAIDLLDRMLVFDPDKRITVEEALAHPYLASLHDPADEPVATCAFDFDFEKGDLTKPLLRELICKEIADFHPSVINEHTWELTGPPVIRQYQTQEAAMEAQVMLQHVASQSSLHPSASQQHQQQQAMLAAQHQHASQTSLASQHAAAPHAAASAGSLL